jgi:SAM-dependent methyltransferase
MTNNKTHWEQVYQQKNPQEVSWTENRPKMALHIIQQYASDLKTSIIDIGGGESGLVDSLVNAGYEDITVLDISENAIEKAKARLGDAAKNVKWIVSDITTFKPERNYDFWYDRATFHFLTKPAHIKYYQSLVNNFANKHLLIGTFSLTGPDKCSGLPVQQYSAESLSDCFSAGFEPLSCQYIDHLTPFNTVQNFVFCTFQKNNPKSF